MTTSIYALVSEICGLLKSTNKHIFKGRENFSGSDQLPPFILLFGRESKTPSDSEAARGRLWGQSSARLESSGMDLVRGKVRWSRTEPRRGREAADGEQGRILLTEAQAPRRQQPKGHSSKPRRKIPGFLRRLRRNKEPQNVCEMETSKDFQHLVQKGQFLEAYESLSVLAQEGQDCGPQFEALAQGMWRVVQQALQGAGHSQELEAVLDTVEATTLLDDGNAAWGGQLGRLLRMDAEARVPTLKPGDQLGPFLEKLDKAVRQGLGSPRASQLGTRLWETYRTCFQEVLCSRLWGLTTGPCGADLKSCLQLYTWGKTACFLRPGRETLLNAPPAAQEPTAGHLLDPIMMFVTWMSQTQEKLVGMIQEKVEAALEKVLICDRKQWAQFSRPKTFLEISQLLEANTKAVQHLGPSITSQVQAVVLKTFSTFLNRYKVEAVGFLQRNATAGAFPEVHVLENCCILRETWQNLSQAHVPPEDLGPAVQGAIHFIEDHSRDHLVPRVRALCQSQLRAHFGSKDKDLVHALQSLWQGLEGCPRLHSSPLYESIMRSLHMVVFGEYLQALATHLRTLEPRKWDSLRLQVEMDIKKLDDIFRRHGAGPLQLRGPGGGSEGKTLLLLLLLMPQLCTRVPFPSVKVLLPQVCCSLSCPRCTSQSSFGQELSRPLIGKCLDGRGPATRVFVPPGPGGRLTGLDGGGEGMHGTFTLEPPPSYDAGQALWEAT
ncbi:uncharacterized protein LOC115301534 isoform X4 [Suricata suricatta]|uniref:uncharacterized protein LOC115301534 isoform X4 n=1 Tax=Suricata suricatta TaxID=37032 RepID=UPI001155A8EC|nr:uncharacterized protein LOC115301534 isoform X4 [Suricata suricatta]